MSTKKNFNIKGTCFLHGHDHPLYGTFVEKSDAPNILGPGNQTKRNSHRQPTPVPLQQSSSSNLLTRLNNRTLWYFFLAALYSLVLVYVLMPNMFKLVQHSHEIRNLNKVVDCLTAKVKKAETNCINSAQVLYELKTHSDDSLYRSSIGKSSVGKSSIGKSSVGKSSIGKCSGSTINEAGNLDDRFCSGDDPQNPIIERVMYEMCPNSIDYTQEAEILLNNIDETGVPNTIDE